MTGQFWKRGMGWQYGKILLANLLFTLAYVSINVPKGIINGGLTSFSMVLSRVSGWPVWVIVDLAMALLLVGCRVFLGRTYFYRSIFSAIFYSVFFSLFTAFVPELPWPLPIGVVLSAVAVGVGCFWCISAKASTLGFDVVAMILHKRNPKIGIARAMFACNTVVVLLGLMTYGVWGVAAGLSGSALQSFTLGRLLKWFPQDRTDGDE